MSEVELVKRLRAPFGFYGVAEEAAATIERLLKERDEARQQRDNWEESAAQYCRNSDHHREKREAAEAQVAALTKALEASR